MKRKYIKLKQKGGKEYGNKKENKTYYEKVR